MKGCWKAITEESASRTGDISRPHPLCENLKYINADNYIRTKFFRALISIRKQDQGASKAVYHFVPIQDFSKPWTDEELYKKYGLNDAEITFIESMIKPME